MSLKWIILCNILERFQCIMIWVSRIAILKWFFFICYAFLIIHTLWMGASKLLSVLIGICCLLQGLIQTITITANFLQSAVIYIFKMILFDNLWVVLYWLVWCSLTIDENWYTCGKSPGVRVLGLHFFLILLRLIWRRTFGMAASLFAKSTWFKHILFIEEKD